MEEMRGEIDSAIEAGTGKDIVRFFMPGHKGRGSIPPIAHDITEVSFSDDLHNPVDCIKTAQDNVARIYGARESYFSCQGSTLMVQAMLYASAGYGGKVIMVQDAHISAINACVLFNLEPVFVMPQYEGEFGVYEQVNPDEIERVLIDNSDCKTVFITSPSYYGVCHDVEEIARIAHKYRAKLIVDSAQGAHLEFFNQAAIRQGADTVCVSTHKTLTAMTQTAVLLNNTLPQEKIREILRILQTSSPSYVLMESIESAVLEANTRRDEFLETADLCNDLRSFCENTGKFKAYRKGITDPFRITLAHNGAELKEKLETRGIFAEIYHKNLTVFLASINNTKDDFNRAQAAILEISRDLPCYKEVIHEPTYKPFVLGKRPKAAYHAQIECVEGEMAAGRIAARSKFIYPPAICTLCPGCIVPKGISDKVTVMK